MGPCGGPHDHEKRVLAMVHKNHPAVYVQVVGIDLYLLENVNEPEIREGLHVARDL